MTRLYLYFLLLTFISPVLGQNECSKWKSGQAHEKSNTLTVAQIDETKKYDVHYYALDVSITDANTDIAGTGEIHATAKVNLDSALFELYNTMTITEIRVNGTPVTYSRNATAIKVPVNASPGQAFIIAVDYNGTPPTTGQNPMGGSGLASHTDNTYNVTTTSSLSQPFSAYEWWPCKQYLGDKADSSSVKMTVPSNCKAGSNGLLVATVDLGNGTTRYEWKNNHPIDYYLISVAVGKYDEYITYSHPNGAPNPVMIQDYIYQNPQFLTDWEFQINETGKIIELYSKLYGLYPFYDQKYGHCVSQIGGGMEHQTMTTQSSFDANLNAHELGHQWFGDHVTCASWADIWVNEGFATYSQYLYLEHMVPTARAQQMTAYHNSVMQYLDGSTYVYGTDTLNTFRIFDYRLTYAKGASIINTMRFIINNDSLFFQGLKDYQINFADSVATGLDVEASLENASGVDLSHVFEEWYYGGGYPTYNLRWNTVGHDLSLEITQYPSSYWETQKFTNPLEISFTRENLPDTTIRFQVSELVNQYYLQHLGRITGVQAIDPYDWIVNKSDTIIHDPNFTATPASGTTIPDVEISPNPTDGPLLIVVRTPGKHTLKVNDSAGKIIIEKEFEVETTVDLNQKAQGLYLLQIQSEYGKKNTAKIIRR